MSNPPGWKWIGRAADVAQLVPVLVGVAFVVVALAKGHDIRDAVGGEPVLLGVVGVLAVVGLSMIGSGIARRRGFARTFRGDRGRGDTAVLITGCFLVSAAIVLLLLLF